MTAWAEMFLTGPALLVTEEGTEGRPVPGLECYWVRAGFVPTGRARLAGALLRGWWSGMRRALCPHVTALSGVLRMRR